VASPWSTPSVNTQLRQAYCTRAGSGGVTSKGCANSQETALKTYEALGCSGFARVDTILEGDTPWVIDVKTIPGFTETSTLPLAAEAAGISFEELVETILDSTLQTEAPAKL